MSQIAFRRATAITLAFVAALGCAADLQAGEPDTLVIRIYDGSFVNAGARAAAIRTAAAIVEDAGIRVEWRDCGRGPAHGGCDGSRAPRDLIVRFIATASPRGSAGAVAEESRVALGFSVVEARTGLGSLATIFLDRVQPVAQRTGIEFSALLGRAIAHEVGHLLLGTNGHGRTGLMREVWTDAELSLNRREDWVFAPAERRQLRAALTRVTQEAGQARAQIPAAPRAAALVNVDAAPAHYDALPGR